VRIRNGGVLLLVASVLVSLGLIWVLAQGCVSIVRQQLHPSESSVLPDEQTAPPSSLQAQDAAQFLPPGSTLLELREADLDNDKESEFVLVFTGESDASGSAMAGAAVVARDGEDYRKTWEMQLSSPAQVDDVVIDDINSDRILEVLVFQSAGEGAAQLLHIFAWDGTEYAVLGADGEGPFVSAYYPPEVRNVDSTGIDEIVVFEDDPSSERLKAVTYRWTGEAYTSVDWIIVPGRPRP
jgi:hypothetical protein